MEKNSLAFMMFVSFLMACFRKILGRAEIPIPFEWFHLCRIFFFKFNRSCCYPKTQVQADDKNIRYLQQIISGPFDWIMEQVSLQSK